jgi:hypothetical protein
VVQTIPIRAITAVSHDRKTLGTDLVNLTVGSVSYEWNVDIIVAQKKDRMSKREPWHTIPVPYPGPFGQH